MAKFKVTADEGFTGDRAGVQFTDGVGEFDSVEQSSALAYFRRHGYGLEEVKAKAASRAKNAED